MPDLENLSGPCLEGKNDLELQGQYPILSLYDQEFKRIS